MTLLLQVSVKGYYSLRMEEFLTSSIKGENRQTFFQEILNVQSMLGGDTDDLQTIRI